MGFDIGGIGHAFSGIWKATVSPLAKGIQAILDPHPTSPPRLPGDALMLSSDGNSRLKRTALGNHDGGLISNNSGGLISNNSGSLLENDPIRIWPA